ncbi:MAG: hypothetical protein AAB470_02360 [Patescibacteria group bacterium]
MSSTSKRLPGPFTAKGDPTLSGIADGKPVFWMVRRNDPSQAQWLEDRYATKSRLGKLMFKKMNTLEGLTPEEFAEAERLIATEPENGTDETCMNDSWGIRCGVPTIADLGVCRKHAFFDLANGTDISPMGLCRRHNVFGQFH